MGDALPPLSLGTSRSARFLDSGAFYSCAVLDNDFLKCWGMNSGGQLGQGDVETRGDEIGEMGDALLVVNLGIGRTAQALSSGAAYTCAVLDDASLKCWGTNNTGALGLGDLENRGDEGGEMGDDLPALDLGTGRTVQTVAVGIGNACALLDDDTVKCWGSNNAGALGLGDTEARGDAAGEMGDALPVVDLGSGGPARALAAGNSFACAVFEDDAVKCWGLNTSGQLGLGNSSGRGDVPGEMGDDLPEVNLGTGRSVRSLTVGSTHCCALLDDNSVKCWGNATNGKLGTGDVAHRGDGANEMGNDLPVVELW
jgi:E3 ubiquitin-protein ligase HERC3